MSGEIDFQNGFICGMTTKGLIKTGDPYEPIVWNDDGVYTYFYIDFKRAVSPFSVGMLAESIILHDSVQITITDYQKISSGVYKIFANIAGRPHGVTVLNKITTLLTFTNGKKIPPFSTHFYIAGIQPYKKVDYAYESIDFVEQVISDSYENVGYEFWEAIEGCNIYETETFSPFIPTSIDEKTVTLILT